MGKVLQIFANEAAFKLEIADLWATFEEYADVLSYYGLVPSSLKGALRINPEVGLAGALFICKITKKPSNIV